MIIAEQSDPLVKSCGNARRNAIRILKKKNVIKIGLTLEQQTLCVNAFGSLISRKRKEIQRNNQNRLKY